MDQRIYQMELFDTLTIKDCIVVRVPGGWTINGTFVAMHNEFKTKTKAVVSEFYPEGYLGVDFLIPKKHGCKSALRYAMNIYCKEHRQYISIGLEFLDHWEAKNKQGVMAYEDANSFALGLRLSTWKRREISSTQESTTTSTPKKTEV